MVLAVIDSHDDIGETNLIFEVSTLTEQFEQVSELAQWFPSPSRRVGARQVY